MAPMTSDDHSAPVRVVTETLDDYGPMVALAIRRPDLLLVPLLREPGSPLPEPGADETMHEFLDTADNETLALWRHFQLLWHRWTVPLDQFNPVRWYLTARAQGSHAAVHSVVDAQLQQVFQADQGRLGTVARIVSQDVGRPDSVSGDERAAVLGWGAPEWSLPAMLLAARTGRPYLWVRDCAEAMGEAGQWAGPLTLSFPHDEATVGQIMALVATRTYPAPGPLSDGLRLASRPLGFLTATSLQVLSSVVSRQLSLTLPLPPTSVAVFTGLDTDPDPGANSFLLNRERSAAGYLEAVGDVTALFLSGHSREDLFHLGPDALCGRSLAGAPSGPSVRLPACVLDGRCVKNGTVLPAHALSAPVAFFNSCNVMRLGGGGAFDVHFTLPFTYQEGAGIAIVGSRRTRFGDDNVELSFAERLLRTGRSMGEVVRLLNNAVPLWGREAPDYLLLGDSEFAPFPAAPSAAAVTTRDAGDGVVEATFTDVEAELLELALDGSGPDPSVRILGVVGPDGQPADIDLRSAMVIERDGATRLFLFSWQPLRLRSLSLRIEPGRPHQDVVADIGTTLANATAYRRLLRTYLKGFDNTEQELRSRATALSRWRAQARTVPLALRDADAAAAELRATIARLDQALCGHLLTCIGAGAFVWLEQYESVDGNFHVARHLPSAACPYCEQEVVVREYRHDYHVGARREFGLCNTCGNVWDVVSGTRPPVVTGEDTALRGTEHAQAVVVANAHDRPLRGAVGLRLYLADKYGVTVTPELRPVSVDPGASREYSFTLKLPEGVPAHMEFLRGFLVSSLGVSVFQRNLWVRPAAGDQGRPSPVAASIPVWPPAGTVVATGTRGTRR